MMGEDGPPARKQRVVAHPLATWDVDELRDYVAELQGEIERAEAAIARKDGHRQAAEAFFRRSGKPA